ncbi:putative cytochrome P450 [Apostichopus japonicus]|uniref:Putative cytochrome P450 n=1 Tax=Stichopus japonicus TaxID=307972 RepID=A0A2G8L2P9_STIJA|nr:putative cytochrome P450 [Apostichopus japonicus]
MKRSVCVLVTSRGRALTYMECDHSRFCNFQDQAPKIPRSPKDTVLYGYLAISRDENPKIFPKLKADRESKPSVCNELETVRLSKLKECGAFHNKQIKVIYFSLISITRIFKANSRYHIIPVSMKMAFQDEQPPSTKFNSSRYKSIETIKEATLDKADSFSDRTASAVFGFIYEGSNGSLVFGHGKNWKEMRKFGANALRNFGVGKRSVANKINEETTFLVAAIEETNGKRFNPALAVNNAVSNIICNISFGERYDYDNVKFQRLLSTLRSSAGAITVTSLLHSIPRVFLRMILCVPPFSGKIREFVVLKSYISDMIREHQSTMDPNDVRDIIDMYLLECEKQEGLGKSETHLGGPWSFIMDLFAAGSDTTTNSLLWALAIFCHYPEVQEKTMSLRCILNLNINALYQEVHKAEASSLHFFLFAAAVLASFQLFQLALLLSFSTVLCHVVLGLPLALEHSGIHPRAINTDLTRVLNRVIIVCVPMSPWCQILVRLQNAAVASPACI